MSESVSMPLRHESADTRTYFLAHPPTHPALPRRIRNALPKEPVYFSDVARAPYAVDDVSIYTDQCAALLFCYMFLLPAACHAQEIRSFDTYRAEICTCMRI
eukprot:4417385-Pleurochrysis_carterae.AAC.1